MGLGSPTLGGAAGPGWTVCPGSGRRVAVGFRVELWVALKEMWCVKLECCVGCDEELDVLLGARVSSRAEATGTTTEEEESGSGRVEAFRAYGPA